MMNFGHMLQILYAFVGGTAFFITVVAFGTLNPRFEFWNTTIHFITSVSFFIDAWFNRIPVRAVHLVFQVTWALVYMIFCWPMTIEDKLQGWPYFFLETKTTAAFAWYAILFILDIIFYLLWWLETYLKEYIAKAIEAKNSNTVILVQPRPDQEQQAP